MNMKALVGAMLLAVAATGGANAAIISKTYAFTIDTDGPVTRHEGAFSYTYDTELYTSSLDWIDFSIGGFAFTVENTALYVFDTFIDIGGVVSGRSGVTAFTDDFWLRFDATRGIGFYYYATADSFIFSGTPIFTEISEPVDVAEPAALGLIASGLAGLWATALRRRRVVA